MNLIELAETGLVPDWLIRIGIRRLLAKRIQTVTVSKLADFTDTLRNSPLAVATDVANDQHYEVPAAFFEKVLGPRLKYSSCFFDRTDASLAEAEVEMLRRTCERALIKDGMRVLELGCGWGSLTLWIAEQFPACDITAVSNSASQRSFIEARARERGLTNVRVITADMRDFATRETFDRIVSVEMFEHMRNYELLFRRVSKWLEPDGKAFVHVFCHRNSPYLFETEGAANWMGRHFFTGGMMPSEDLFSHFADDLAIEKQWRVNGMHYWRTCEAWLNNLDHHRDAILDCFRADLSDREAELSLQRWRIFFMACAELFRYRGGDEWFVSHYLFESADKESSCERLPHDEQLQPTSYVAYHES
ncbi:MAG: class I SAM-dependent methyltransferase [Planctomycetaceae bacterium]|nr:class I SAM-dependent methyltransferase [Planctomycetaceae bacterium]